MKTGTETLNRLKKKAEKGSRILENKHGSRAGVYVSEVQALLNEVFSSPDRNNSYIEALYIMYEAGANAGYQIAKKEGTK